jgi:putative membrane protein
MDWIKLSAKGFAMGAADLVPGVSGGTIAFISGIYDELISTIAGLGMGTLIDLFKVGPFEVWKKYNLSFLFVLVLGLMFAVFTLAGPIHWIQIHHPSELRAFFFGLVLASAPIIVREIRPYKLADFVWGIWGIMLALILTNLPPSFQSESPIFIAICGAIAICAMLLPGISGSFILVILGAYNSIISALANFDIVRVGAFCLGAFIGLLSFSRILKKILHNFRAQTLAILTGFMLGSLHVLWPWKEQIELLFTHRDGREEWITKNVLPDFQVLEISTMLIIVAIGSGVVMGLEKLSKTK